MEIVQRHFFIVFLLVLLIVSYGYFTLVHKDYSSVTTFDECVSHGYPRTDSYPEICSMPGKKFTNPLQKKHTDNTKSPTIVNTLEKDYKNLSYFVAGQKIDFKDGVSISSSTSPDVSFSMSTSTFMFTDTSSTLYGVFLVKKINEVSQVKQIEYYLASARSLNTGSVGLTMLLIGKDISSPEYSFTSNILTVNYTTEKGIRATKHFSIENDIMQENKR